MHIMSEFDKVPDQLCPEIYERRRCSSKQDKLFALILWQSIRHMLQVSGGKQNVNPVNNWPVLLLQFKSTGGRASPKF
jgi:hypothetical protein